MESIRDRARSEGGFTLIELLVVMIIIAILMAVAVPTFLSQKSNGLRTQATSNVDQIKNAVESCAANNTDNTYTNCTTLAQVQAFEKGLANLDATHYKMGSTNQGAADSGYWITGSVRDGQQDVWFGYATYGDGTVIKHCGAGQGAAPAAAQLTTPPTIAQWGGTAVANSRICSQAATATKPNQW